MAINTYARGLKMLGSTFGGTSTRLGNMVMCLLEYREKSKYVYHS